MASFEAEAFGGGGFDGYAVGFEGHDLCEGLGHEGDEGHEFGFLEGNGAVDVFDVVAFGGDDVDDVGEEAFAVGVFEFVVVVGEVEAYVAHIGGAEESVADGVY